MATDSVFMWCKTFCTYADTLNQNATALALNLAQSTVSRHLESLKKYVGYELIASSDGKVNLTERGELLYLKINSSVSILSDLKSLPHSLEGDRSLNIYATRYIIDIHGHRIERIASEMHTSVKWNIVPTDGSSFYSDIFDRHCAFVIAPDIDNLPSNIDKDVWITEQYGLYTNSDDATMQNLETIDKNVQLLKLDHVGTSKFSRSVPSSVDVNAFAIMSSKVHLKNMLKRGLSVVYCGEQVADTIGLRKVGIPSKFYESNSLNDKLINTCFYTVSSISSYPHIKLLQRRIKEEVTTLKD